jgi:hypothetical protein
VTIRGNAINNAGNNGIHLRNNTDVNVLSNLITNSGNRGLYVSGQDNGLVVLTDNIFTNNPIGAEFESGQIDMTGAANSFNGGDRGLVFDPTAGGDPLKLALVGDTIGETIFNGQATYYVELRNGALFAPGTPTLIDGLNATYDGFRPSDVGGILTQAQYNALEAKIFHFNDVNSLGLFFFGQVPAIDQEDIFKGFNAFGGPGSQFRVTLLGLPRLPGQIPGNLPGGFGGNLVNFLANIAPAAGGNGQDPTPLTPEQLAAIAPAAGGGDGGTQDAACWSQAIAAANSGAIVNYSFGATMEEALNQAAACGADL